MNVFYKICVVLLIVGGINWGLVGLFNFNAVAWLFGGAQSLLSRAVFTLVGVAALCAVPGLFEIGSGGDSHTHDGTKEAL